MVILNSLTRTSYTHACDGVCSSGHRAADMFTDEEDAHVMRHYLGVDLLVDGSLGFLLLLNGQQVHQRTDGHPLHHHATQTRRNNGRLDYR